MLQDVAAHRAEHERLHRAAATAPDDDQLGVVRVVDQRGAGGRLGDDELDLVGVLARDGRHRRPQQLLGCLAVRLMSIGGTIPGPVAGIIVDGIQAWTARTRVPRIDASWSPYWSASLATSDPSTPITIMARTYHPTLAARAEWTTVIDLRSDTVTRPTPGMRAAIAAAVVGDEQMQEDPTVNELQERVAELLGQERALFLPTATMANQIALKLHSRPGDVLIAEEHSHVLVYEFGGAAAHAGLLTVGLPGIGGRLTAAQVHAACSTAEDVVDQRPAVLVVENTHNVAGGRVWPLAELDAVVAVAREAGVGVHMDGARMMNAAVALGVAAGSGRLARRHRHALPLEGARLPARRRARRAGRPDGGRLAAEVPVRRRDATGGDRRRGGAVRARSPRRAARGRPRACPPARRGLARRRASRWSSTGSRRTSSRSTPRGSTCRGAEVLAVLREAGVGLSPTYGPTHIRAVTHLDLDDDDIDRALELVPAALEAAHASA